jgi:hypothetical protein
MAIEFDTKLRRPLPVAGLLRRTTGHLRNLGVSDSLQIDEQSNAELGVNELRCVATLGDVEASLLCHKTGEESALGEEGGFWLTASADLQRTGAGALLALVLVAAAAEEVGSPVIDEVGRLGLKRSIPPDEVLRRVQELVGVGDLTLLASRFARALGLNSAR